MAEDKLTAEMSLTKAAVAYGSVVCLVAGTDAFIGRGCDRLETMVGPKDIDGLWSLRLAHLPRSSQC